LWQAIKRCVVIVHGQAKLFKIVAAAHPPGRFACRLNRREQKPYQHTDDCNHDEQFHQRKACSHSFHNKSSKV
jgi:hypothetical protein